MPMAPRRTPAESEGNATLLVLGDRRDPESLHLPETVFAALEHAGIPYRFFDLSSGRLGGVDLSSHPEVLIGQEHLGARLGADEVRDLLRAVEGGLGLVSLDQDVAGYGPSFLDALGLEGVASLDGPAVGGTQAVLVVDGGHFVTATKPAGTARSLRAPVPITRVRRARPEVSVLAGTPSGEPLLVTRRIARGRVAQWLVSPKLWTRPYLGHAAGLDDLFFKAVIWAARKPFAMLAMPPFVRLRLDDCNGHWSNAADFGFVDTLSAFGHVPCLCVCVRAITDDGAGKLRELGATGRAEFAPHTLEPGVGLFYGDDHGEYTAERLRALMDEVDERFRRWGIPMSRVLSDHGHEYSARVIPLLRARGIRYKMNVTLPDERRNGPHVDWRPAPYGSMSYALDYTSDERDLFVVFNHFPTFDYARAYLPDGRFLLNRSGGFGPYTWDFLNGLTTHRRERPSNDVEAAARRLADHVTLGLDSLFFGGSISHSHFTRELADEEWRTLLSRFEALTARYEKRYAGYDAIAEYARSKFDTRIARAERDEPRGSLRYVFTGEATTALELSVFTDRDQGVERRYEIVPPFRGRSEVEVTHG